MVIFEEKDHGPIPHTILKIYNLNMFFSSNHLAGEIPDSFGQFRHLAYHSFYIMTILSMPECLVNFSNLRSTTLEWLEQLSDLDELNIVKSSLES